MTTTTPQVLDLVQHTQRLNMFLDALPYCIFEGLKPLLEFKSIQYQFIYFRVKWQLYFSTEVSLRDFFAMLFCVLNLPSYLEWRNHILWIHFFSVYCGFNFFHGYHFSWNKENIYVCRYLILWFCRCLHSRL